MTPFIAQLTFSTNSGGEAPETSGGSTSKILNVGVLVSTVGIPALYAQDQGWFEEAGLKLTIVQPPEDGAAAICGGGGS